MCAVENVDLLISGGIVVTMDPQERIFPNGAVAVRDSKLCRVGPREEVEKTVHPKNVIDASGTVIMPGLVNAHTHAAMTLFRGLADDIPLKPWLGKDLAAGIKICYCAKCGTGIKAGFC